ncbi:hypothetical protein [Lactococcus lactis]|uniref:hypothetical protein n=1 Tax=Lactococcus lactis TaxID=1358 RepID=UPI00288F7F7C|nr:hypothetical protein [Lactococcus lactis]MDT2909321.1 hypothetical protein [Lactococcus lactis]MDT2952008.1 hypothetical protein [Lactococcus lactis]
MKYPDNVNGVFYDDNEHALTGSNSLNLRYTDVVSEEQNILEVELNSLLIGDSYGG